MFKYLLIPLILFSLSNAKAQTYKTFINDKGETLKDSANATSYIIYSKIDSVWFMKQYDISDSIMVMGTYKDPQLTIQHGKFIYYQFIKPSASPSHNYATHKTDTIKTAARNFIKQSGYFVNGIMEGKWAYFDLGKLHHISTYKDGKLNGLTQYFNTQTGHITFQGNYINDVRDGYWYELTYNGDTLNTEVFKNGAFIKRYNNAVVAKKYEYNIKGGYPAYDIGTYLSNKLSANVLKQIKDGDKISYSFVLDKEGHLTKPFVINGLGLELDEAIIDALLACPKWQLAYHDKEIIELSIPFDMEFRKSNNTIKPVFGIKDKNFNKF